MTTATRRLRRAGVAGLASIATAAYVVASAGGAAAFAGTTGTIGLASGASANGAILPGGSAQGLPGVSVVLANTAWVAGDFLTFGLSSVGTAITPICATNTNAGNTFGLATAPTVATSDSGGATVTAGTTALQSSANCSVSDQFKYVLPAPPADAGSTTFTFSGLSLNAGSGPAITAATNVFVTATASNGTPFTGPTATKGIQVGTIALTQVSSAGSVGVTPSQTGVVPPTITVKDIIGGQVVTPLLFQLSAGDTWTTLPTLTTPSGVTAATVSTAPTGSISYTLTGATPAGGVYTLSGGVVSFAATLGAATVTVKVGAGPTTLGAPQIAFVGAQNRVGGADRYATAALIFNEQFGTATATAAGITPAFTAPAFATNVVVTSGANFPDALSSAYLASSLHTGILLTDPNALSPTTQNVLTNGHIGTVYIVGGTAAVSQNVQNSIAALHIGNVSGNAFLTVIRVAGSDRYGTNEAADLNAGVIGSGTVTAVLATGTNFADALAASPAIAKAKLPLILTDPATLSQSAIDTITALGVKNVIILGGTGAVSAAVETAVGKLSGVSVSYRIAGADRTLTSQQIALWETVGLAASSPYGALAGLAFAHAGSDNVNISNGQNFPDALAAGPALAFAGAGALGESLLLTGSPTALGAGIPALLNGHAATYSTVSAIGLAGAVSSSVLAQAGGQIS